MDERNIEGSNQVYSKVKFVITPIGDQNTNVNAWYRLIKAYIKKEGYESDEEVYLAAIMFSTGNAQERISKLEDEIKRIPTLEECVESLLELYKYKHINKGNTFTKLKMITINPSESISEFNNRFHNLYHDLEENEKEKISMYDYLHSLKERPDIAHEIYRAMPKTVIEACEIALRTEEWKTCFKLQTINHDYNNGKEQNRSKNFNHFHRKNNIKMKPYWNHHLNKNDNHDNYDKNNEKFNRNDSEQQVKTCYRCGSYKHLKKNCPLREQKHLN